ncbi:hypothetical protein DNTS_023837 [Danionella cerebrum]|uniref:Uncharacterized protein n=1 Tax=Danionella cerebrum TaxID=2873325 RepID=A0A553QSX7_9TELE|nr:hypothetical protein DNTS_023837 [Danionella translucida]
MQIQNQLFNKFLLNRNSLQFLNIEPMIANCTVKFQTIFINEVVVKNLFMLATENNTVINNLQINRSYTNGLLLVLQEKGKKGRVATSSTVRKNIFQRAPHQSHLYITPSSDEPQPHRLWRT